MFLTMPTASDSSGSWASSRFFSAAKATTFSFFWSAAVSMRVFGSPARAAVARRSRNSGYRLIRTRWVSLAAGVADGG
jgi:hypothetical protein